MSANACEECGTETVIVTSKSDEPVRWKTYWTCPRCDGYEAGLASAFGILGMFRALRGPEDLTLLQENERLRAEILEARNEAATVRRAFMHEMWRAREAIVALHAYDPECAEVYRKAAYNYQPVIDLCSK